MFLDFFLYKFWPLKNSGNGHVGGRANFLATPTLASPVAQQFSQLSISPQQVSHALVVA